MKWIMKNLILQIFIIFFLYSCTHTSKNDSASNEEPYAVEEDIPAQLSPQKEETVHVVEIRQMQFVPDTIKVHKGDRILWVNKDIMNHDVTETSKKTWSSAPLKTGSSWTLVVTEGADYYCSLHQVMKGKIILQSDQNE
ncbi:plastocyanin/azurin family copper-binding protein [Chryseolinea sp. H1M3-3]|uniref:plastocyanin/azurin family copper-binding protein n=1 Tax=Chryseolinea sp. H1M3-3 TaxID=3034144 RepID=UPI0023EB9754|nr:plastocyanin/azurin family copper-binding protein [Chryseolinea sp. H1M3-3]